MTGLSELAIDIYRDQATQFGYEVVQNSPQLRTIINNVVRDAFEPLPDPAAPLVAARLLRDLVTIRRHLPLNSGTAWALVETYLLMNDCTITAANDEIASLIETLLKGRLDGASTFHLLAAMAEPSGAVH